MRHVCKCLLLFPSNYTEIPFSIDFNVTVRGQHWLDKCSTTTLSLSLFHTHTLSLSHSHTHARTHKRGTDMDMINYVSSIPPSMNEWPNDYRLPTTDHCLQTLETKFSCSSLSRKGTTRNRSKETINHHSFHRRKTERTKITGTVTL